MYDTGTTAFMILSTALVVVMTPALALYYGGLSRRKNVVNTMMMSIIAMGIVGVVWVLVGQSIAYGGGAPFDENGNLIDVGALFFGGFDQLFSSSAVNEAIDVAGAASGDGTIGSALFGSYPNSVGIAFQASFAMVTTAIVTGSLAGRIKFGAAVAIIAIWPILVYAPIAHMVWGGGIIGNPDAIGALDFAGGDAVHISSGVSGLVLALILGRRRDFEVMSYRPHNVPFVMLGAGLLFLGWFGFNGGSALSAGSSAGLAILNTMTAACAATFGWAIVERIKTGKATLVGASTGTVAGLVVITPAAGFVAPWAAAVMGLIVCPICYFAMSYLKHKLRYDDALDAFGCHGIGGIVGGILTGVFCIPELSTNGLGGLIYTGDFTLLGHQILGVLFTIVFVAVVAAIIGFVVKAFFRGNLRVDEEIETRGFDATVHGESGYPAFNGLD